MCGLNHGLFVGDLLLQKSRNDSLSVILDCSNALVTSLGKLFSYRQFPLSYTNDWSNKLGAGCVHISKAVICQSPLLSTLPNRMASPHFPVLVLGLPFRFRTLQLPSRSCKRRFFRCIPLMPKYRSSSHGERVTRSRCGYVHIVPSEEAGKIHSDRLVRLPSPRASPSPSRDRQASRRDCVLALTMAAMNVNGAK